jgi:hypothetical protein
VGDIHPFVWALLLQKVSKWRIRWQESWSIPVQDKALIVYNQTLRDIEHEELKNFEVVQLQLPQYKPLSKDFLEVLSKHVRELVVEINNNPAGISGSYTSYNNFSKDNIEMWIL